MCVLWFAEAQISVSDAVRVLEIARKEETPAIVVVGQTASDLLQVIIDDKILACCLLGRLLL